MILTCEECDTSFNFPDNLIKETGSKVRCSKCRHIFVAYPSSGAEQSAAQPQLGAQDPVAGVASGLDDVNLNEIEDMLDLGIEEVEESAVTDVSGDDDFELDLDIEEDVTGGSTKMEFEETQELDFSDIELDGDQAESGGSGGAAESLDLDLGLDFEDSGSPSEAESTPESAETEDLSFGLDLEGDTDSESDMAMSGAEVDEASDELDFELDLDEGDESEEFSSELELEETQELDVSDMDNLLDVEEAPEAEAQSDELDFDLDLESEAADSGTPDEPPSDATAELELSELEDMMEMEEAPAASIEPDASAEELDFGLGLESQASAPADGAPAEAELEETEEFDLSDLDKMLDDDEELPAPAEAAEISDDDFKLEIAEEDSQALASDADFEETAEFDLSDLENMLEDEDEAAPVHTGAEVEDLDVTLDMEGETETAAELFDADDSADVELEFEMEDSAPAELQTADAAATSALPGPDDELDDTFDMGTLTDEADGLETEDAELAYEMLAGDEIVSKKKSKPAARTGLSGPFRILLLLVLLLGGGYAVYTLSETMGFKIPFLKEIKGIKIPYVSDLFGTKVQDQGNLKISILAKKVDGWFVENTKGGTLFVIRGQVKNVYKQPRNFIRVTAKIYSKGGKQSRVKTVYAGNLLTEKELSTMSPDDINKRLNKRFGDQKSNVKIKSGKVIPFMIVFSKLPPNPDEYTVEVTSSDKG
jgi:predicted Zn finger-like uncharacterized protein